MAKISVGVFLLRIVKAPFQRRLLWAAMIVTAIAGACAFFMAVLQCSPLNYFWDQALGAPGHCIAKTTVTNMFIVFMSIGGTCDFIFGLLPIWIVKELTISRRAKATAGILLSMGAV